MSFFKFFSFADTSVGKIDKSSLSQQTLMELLFQGLKNTQGICSTGTAPTEISHWGFTETNDSQEVISINWSFRDLRGTMDMRWIPESVESFSTKSNSLEGSVDFTVLPTNLRVLVLSSNKYTGQIILDHLKKLEGAWLQMNSFSGTLCLENLSPKLNKLDVSKNRLTGLLCLTKLPPSLNSLLVDANQFSGNIDVTQLPQKMQSLVLAENNLEGETDFSKLPESLQLFDVHDTRLSGTLVVPSLRQFYFYDTNIQSEKA
mmetsp:Transcript_39932/g.63110  ORF Transcript_39932/g.63110 Transcript_39932/m.63110 type:complete len:260 (-) Transcript_39932:49-828(-)